MVAVGLIMLQLIQSDRQAKTVLIVNFILSLAPVVAVEVQSVILHTALLDDRVVQEVVLDITQAPQVPVPQRKDITAARPTPGIAVKVVEVVPVR
jgi:hypothetical protein|tara:strand:- start:297 stop:581 length:285 start_codon:yes stop_codon:yes gene_type:complete